MTQPTRTGAHARAGFRVRPELTRRSRGAGFLDRQLLASGCRAGSNNDSGRRSARVDTPVRSPLLEWGGRPVAIRPLDAMRAPLV